MVSLNLNWIHVHDCNLLVSKLALSIKSVLLFNLLIIHFLLFFSQLYIWLFLLEPDDVVKVLVLKKEAESQITLQGLLHSVIKNLFRSSFFFIYFF